MPQNAIILVQENTGFQPLFGVPAVRRLTLILTRLGFAHIHVIGRVNSVMPLLTDLIPSRRFHAAEDPESLDRAIHDFGLPENEAVLVLKASHVVDRHTLQDFLKNAEGAAACLAGADSERLSDRIYLVSPALLSSVLPILWSGEQPHAALLDQVRRFKGTGRMPHVVEGNPKGGLVAEEALVTALAMQTHADDGYIARHFDRHISRMVSKRAARTGLTPNTVTLLGMTTGLIAALLLSLPGYWPHILGSLLFVFCVIVDGVDGEIARLKLMESQFGHYLDIVTDNIVHVAIFVGIAFGLYHGTGSKAYLQLLWILLGGFCLCLIAVYQAILRLSDDELQRSPASIRFMALLSNRDFAYLIAVLAIFNRLEWFLIGSALGSYVFAIALWIISSREKRKNAVVQPQTQ